MFGKKTREFFASKKTHKGIFAAQRHLKYALDKFFLW